MSEFKNKNIDALLSKFFSPEQAEQIKNDFASADALFEKFPAPNPPQQTLADIKQKISQRLENQKQVRWPAVFIKTAAIAVIIVIIHAVMPVNFNKTKPNQYVKTVEQSLLWQDEETDVSAYNAEITQLKNELMAINLGEETSANGILTDSLQQLELEIIETENTFWKG
jgi:hypothetical protein